MNSPREAEQNYLMRVAEATLVTAVEEFRALPFYAKHLFGVDRLLRELQEEYLALTGKRYVWETREDEVALRNLRKRFE